ncbi:hypothetical protein AAMO2058_000850000 [Amorphochlora amoebiformis]
MDVRRTAVSLGSIKTADGSALAKVGGTTVACGLKLEVGIPSALKPKEGRFEVSLKLASLCSPEINKKSLGRTFVGNDKRIDAMAATIKKTIASSQMMNLEELCIKEGASVWVVYIDLVCVDFSGNIFDAALMAVGGALRSLQLPPTQIAEDGEVMLSREGKSSRLTIKRYPISISFGILDQKHIVADPTAEEEKLLEGRLSVAFTTDGHLCLVHKEGRESISSKRINDCLDIAEKYAEKMVKKHPKVFGFVAS